MDCAIHKQHQSGEAVFSCKQGAENAAFPTGVYISVHEQGKTQVRQWIAPQIKAASLGDGKLCDRY